MFVVPERQWRVRHLCPALTSPTHPVPRGWTHRPQSSTTVRRRTGSLPGPKSSRQWSRFQSRSHPRSSSRSVRTGRFQTLSGRHRLRLADSGHLTSRLPPWLSAFIRFVTPTLRWRVPVVPVPETTVVCPPPRGSPVPRARCKPSAPSCPPSTAPCGRWDRWNLPVPALCAATRAASWPPGFQASSPPRRRATIVAVSAVCPQSLRRRRQLCSVLPFASSEGSSQYVLAIPATEKTPQPTLAVRIRRRRHV